jgi:hypothetical protein
MPALGDWPNYRERNVLRQAGKALKFLFFFDSLVPAAVALKKDNRAT